MNRSINKSDSNKRNKFDLFDKLFDFWKNTVLFFEQIIVYILVVELKKI
jgi:hypothetical protein